MNHVITFLDTPAFWGFSWLEILGLYMLPGISYSIFHLVKLYFDQPSKSARAFLAVIKKKKGIADYLGDILVYSIAVICIATAWPAFLIWAYFKSKRDAAWAIERDKPDFTCLPEYLVAKEDPATIENSNFIADPLNTVPHLPFGHLNKGWVNFLETILDPADEIWSFYIPKGSKCGKHRFAASGDIRGYAKVKNGEILGEFVTESD